MTELTNPLEDLRAFQARLESGLARVMARRIAPPTEAELTARRKMLEEVADRIGQLEQPSGRSVN